MNPALEHSPERLEQLRVALRREDPHADVRGGSTPDTVEVSSDLSHERVAQIMTGVLGLPVRNTCGDDADVEGCCGCCGH